MGPTSLSESDICDQFITPAILRARWDQESQFRREITYTTSRNWVRGRMARRNAKRKRAACVLYNRSSIPLAVIEANPAPSQHKEPLCKTILGNCQSVVNTLGTLRANFGDAHGKAPRQVKPAPLRAEPAVHLAETMTAFLVAIWEAHQLSTP